MTKKERLANELMTKYRGEENSGMWDWIVSGATNSNATNRTWRAWADAFWELYEQNQNSGSIVMDEGSGFIHYAGGKINYSPVSK